MRAEELWKTYCEKEKIDIDTPYEAWRFGDAPDKLADLVLKGIKTATASGYVCALLACVYELLSDF